MADKSAMDCKIVKCRQMSVFYNFVYRFGGCVGQVLIGVKVCKFCFWYIYGQLIWNYIIIVDYLFCWYALKNWTEIQEITEM